MKNFFLGFIILLTLPLYSFSQVSWNTDYQKASAVAENTKKPMFIFLFTPQSAACQQYDNQTFTNAELANLLNSKFVPLRIDATANQPLASSFGVFRVPVIIILDQMKREFLRIITYYPPDRLVYALSQINPTGYSPSNETQSTITDIPANAKVLFYQSFNNLFGWENNASTEGCTAQISLVQGVKGNAFKIDYQLLSNKWNFIQILKTLPPGKPLILPEKFTIIFYISGTGVVNSLDIKFADSDGTNYGAIVPIPVDFKPHKMVLTSNEVKYLWGGKDQKLDRVEVQLLGISPKPEYISEKSTAKINGTLYIDEMVILEGIYK